MPSPNTLPISSGLFTSTAPTLNIPVVAPQIADEANASLAKINQLLYNSAGGGSSSSGSYTAAAPYYASSSAAGSLPESLTSFTFSNVGAAPATFGGVSVPTGVTLNFNASPGTKFSQVAFDATGTTVLIAGSRLI